MTEKLTGAEKTVPVPEDSNGVGWVPATLRSASIVTGFVLVVLAAYGQNWALLPLAVGAGLSAALLAAMNLVIRRLFRPENAAQFSPRNRAEEQIPPPKNASDNGSGKKKTRKNHYKPILIGFALIKYPLVAALIWSLTRVWDSRSLMVFAGGFVLVHLVIALRAIGRILFIPETL